jgi:hypothetical protein
MKAEKQGSITAEKQVKLSEMIIIISTTIVIPQLSA